MNKTSADKAFTSRTPVGNGAVKMSDPFEEAKALTKEQLQTPNALKSGYGILYGETKEGSWLPFDKKGNDLAKTLITASSKTSGIRVEVTERKTKKGFKVESIKEID